LKSRSLSYATVEKFLANLKEKFEEGDDKIMKVAELKKVEQKSRIIKEFVQEFRRVVRSSRYEGRLLVKEFKRDMNKVIR